jgi:hypothetical protein
MTVLMTDDRSILPVKAERLKLLIAHTFRSRIVVAPALRITTNHFYTPMRLLTLSLLLFASSPLRVFGGEVVTEKAAAEQYEQAEEELKEAQVELESTEAKIRGETIDRQEEPKAGEPLQGNLRGTNGLARSSTAATTEPIVVDEEEAELAREQAKEKLAENKFEEAIGEMAKFFEYHEKRTAGMRANGQESP